MGKKKLRQMAEKRPDGRLHFYETTFFMWTFLIIFPPLGIITMWICHRDMLKKKKIIITTLAVIWFCILAYANHEAALKRKLDPDYVSQNKYTVENVIDSIKESKKSK